MCLQTTQVRPYQKWHWAGDEIVHDTIIPASRYVPDTRPKKRFDIDIREYLSIAGNAVVRRELRNLIDGLPADGQNRFFIGAQGNFDFRADKITQHFGRLKYIPVGRGFDTWMFPDETLARGGGDCEDLAFLMAALLESAGISQFCIRVALGSVNIQVGTKTKRIDHAWVVYQNEDGGWEILEPLAAVNTKLTGRISSARASNHQKTQRQTVEYIPHFVFNSEHLWRIRGPESRANKALVNYLGDREFWTKFDPTFAAGVHKSIFDDALGDLLKPDELILVKRASFWLDVNVLAYDPRDHFDFAYVDEGWRRVEERLTTGRLKDFGLAGHTIADFYAHTVYGEFGKVDNGDLALFDPDSPDLENAPFYEFAGCKFDGCDLAGEAAAEHWKGQLISGQWWRWYSTFPHDLEATEDFKQFRRCLPDHDAIAVDSAKYPGNNHRYGPVEFIRQFNLREQAAVKHIRDAYLNWKEGKSPVP